MYYQYICRDCGTNHYDKGELNVEADACACGGLYRVAVLSTEPLEPQDRERGPYDSIGIAYGAARMTGAMKARRER